MTLVGAVSAVLVLMPSQAFKSSVAVRSGLMAHLALPYIRVANLPGKASSFSQSELDALGISALKSSGPYGGKAMYARYR